MKSSPIDFLVPHALFRSLGQLLWMVLGSRLRLHCGQQLLELHPFGLYTHSPLNFFDHDFFFQAT